MQRVTARVVKESFSKVVATAIQLLRHIVDGALGKHENVVVVMAEGNHDISSSIWLPIMFKALYEHEPRLTVPDSQLPYYVYQHGATTLAFYHGHLKKNDQLLLFAAQLPQVWGGHGEAIRPRRAPALHRRKGARRHARWCSPPRWRLAMLMRPGEGGSPSARSE